MFMDNEPAEERLVADWTLTLEDTFEVENAVANPIADGLPSNSAFCGMKADF